MKLTLTLAALLLVGACAAPQPIEQCDFDPDMTLVKAKTCKGDKDDRGSNRDSFDDSANSKSGNSSAVSVSDARGSKTSAGRGSRSGFSDSNSVTGSDVRDVSDDDNVVNNPSTKPGNGWGDKNHDHSGPPGQNKDKTKKVKTEKEKSNASEHNGKGGNDGKGGKSRDGSKNADKGRDKFEREGRDRK